MKLVTFSGIDGSGKTRLAQAVADALRARGLRAVYGRPDYACNAHVMRYCELRFGDEYGYFPGLPPDFYISVLSTDWLRWYMDFLLQVPDDTVVCSDRYVIDVYAQAVQYGARLEPLQEVFRVLPTPDLSVFLDTAPEMAVERIRARGTRPHPLEGLEQLTALAASYPQAAARVGWTFTRLPTTESVEALVDRVLGCWDDGARTASRS